MRLKDIDDIREAGLISDEQRQSIIEHFKLEHPRLRFLTVLAAFGGALLLCGVILLISANWEIIPGLVKVISGAALMVGAHLAGWKLRGTNNTHPKSGEAFHFLGAGLFLANLALVSQVYHLSGRFGGMLLIWLIGIAPLAWLLRSVPVHVLSLVGLYFWIGAEFNSVDGWFHAPGHLENQFVIYAAVGLLLYGSGLWLKRTRFSIFAPANERVGMIALHLGLWPAVLDEMGITTLSHLIVAIVPALVGLGFALSEIRRQKLLTDQWRKVWIATLGGWIVLAALGKSLGAEAGNLRVFERMSLSEIVVSIGLVVGCLVQIRVAEELRAPWLVTLGVVTTGFTILATFFLLVGSMMHTGLIFVVGGAGMLGLGIWLENKRRTVIQRIHA